MLLRQQFPVYTDTLSLNIPESRNTVPDLLDEIRWNLEWMLAMQDTDGGVWHKMTTYRFPGTIMPAADNSPLVVVMKNAASTFNFAAVAALASRLYRPFDASLADQSLAAARRAFAWGLANRTVTYVQPADVVTGEYGDATVTDERFWAAVELYAATGDSTAYFQEIINRTWSGTAPTWQQVRPLATLSVALQPALFPSSLADSARARIVRDAQRMLDTLRVTSYGLAVRSSDFFWGSNSQVANQGLLMLAAHILTGETAFREGSEAHLDYLLGRNPLNRSYVTGFGRNPPRNPHHRPSAADGIPDPVPGMLSGGPHTGGQDLTACGSTRRYVTNFPATSYIDHYCSYATNEVAINWNSPLATLSGMLDALHKGHQPTSWLATTAGLRRPGLSGQVLPVRATRTAQGLELQIEGGSDRVVEILDLEGRLLNQVQLTVGQPVTIQLGRGTFILRSGSAVRLIPSF